MSAQRQIRALIRPMTEADLDAVMAIELRAYPYPWTDGIFRDCVRAGHHAWVLDRDGSLCGYGVLSIAANEGHLLNVCVAPEFQGRGLGRRLLRRMLDIARWHHAHRVFLEVRPSNTHALALYQDEGFNEVGRRRGYYPDGNGREDAVVMAMELLSGDDWPPK
ncbi:MAG: ribosomal-protein-alanine N-acetyltransferase [Gammaproteobacteria bacterium HGW-Gammaproteobacteria-4]|jgi:ribosomal-protein-alanine N-acetyltransferase|nr:MAG: ribosomal-protein-alanine N-acetyltransferase [Gammaproteobacteria bacterium HGW-Gammaproteobacteria-4]